MHPSVLPSHSHRLYHLSRPSCGALGNALLALLLSLATQVTSIAAGTSAAAATVSSTTAVSGATVATGAAANATATAARSLRVGTFNIRYANKGDGPNAWEHRKEMVTSLIEFHGWDVFGLQEALAEQIDDVSAAIPRCSWVGVGRDDGKRAGEFAPIFWDKQRFEKLADGAFWLSATPDQPSKGWDAECRRTCVWAKLHDRTSGRVFFVFNTHLDHRGKEARVQGAALIAARIRAIAAPSDPVLLMGDFNTPAESVPYKTFAALLKDSRSISLAPPYGPFGTTNQFNWNAPLKNCIDYIFVSSGIVVQKYGVLSDNRNQRWPSDHLPVMVQLQLP